MARVEMVMPKMGESIMEGTVIEWSKKIGDTIEQDETILEIATDKVDSEVPAPESGILVEILAEAGDVIEVGEPIAIIETDMNADINAGGDEAAAAEETAEEETAAAEPQAEAEEPQEAAEPDPLPAAAEEEADVAEAAGEEEQTEYDGPLPRRGKDGQFFSPLVRSIAEKENISQKELESIEGSGAQGRVSKEDVVAYIESRAAREIEAEDSARREQEAARAAEQNKPKQEPAPAAAKAPAAPPAKEAEKAGGGLVRPVEEKAAAKRDHNEIKAGEIHVNRPIDNIQVVKMDRMRKVIADHMIRSKQTSAHVTTFGEADVTNLVKFRNKHKNAFYANNGFKLTFTPFFIEATIQALREFPLVNSSVNGDEIHLKRDINYGIAVALGESGSGGLVVPVIKNAGDMNLHGIARSTHNLAERARQKQLSPDDLSGGTFTLTNYGSVGNLMGTPIINQPQVAIFGTGVIQKRPMVMEVDGNDVIAIRHMVYLSMSYDHRIIDGALGGAFVQRVKQLLENFDPNRSL